MSQSTPSARADVIETVGHIAHALGEMTEPYCLIGSAALCLTACPLDEVGDVDVLTTARGLNQLAGQLGGEPERRSPSSLFRSASFCRISSTRLTVEIMSGLNVKTDAGWQAVWPEKMQKVLVQDHAISVASLEDQIRFLSLFNRAKDRQRLQQLQSVLSAR